jgi:hypothetical protein
MVLVEKIVLYGCETWSITLREEHRLRVYEKRVRGRICGPNRGEATGGFRKLHNSGLYYLKLMPNIIRAMR